MVDENAIHINQALVIPVGEVDFRFSTSSGPGGQHVNKAETRVTLLFDVANSPSLSDAQRARLLAKLSSRLDKNGALQVTAQESRSQHKNRALALARFQNLLAQALKQPKKRKKTKPSKSAVEKRLAKKKKRGKKKQERGRDWSGEQ